MLDDVLCVRGVLRDAAAFARIIPGGPEVRNLAHADQQKVVSFLQGAQELGGLVGRILMPFLPCACSAENGSCTFFRFPDCF